MHGAARVCVRILAALAAVVLLVALAVTPSALRAHAAGERPPAPLEPFQWDPAPQIPPTVNTPIWEADFGENGENFDVAMSQLMRVLSGEAVPEALRRPAPDGAAAAAKQPGHAHRRQRSDSPQQPRAVTTPQAPEHGIAAPGPETATDDKDPPASKPPPALLAAQTKAPTADSPAPEAKRRQRAPPVRVAGKRVASERCQWLADTVNDSMRWYLHEEHLSISEEQPFPRIWYGNRCHDRRLNHRPL